MRLSVRMVAFFIIQQVGGVLVFLYLSSLPLQRYDFFLTPPNDFNFFKKIFLISKIILNHFVISTFFITFALELKQ